MTPTLREFPDHFETERLLIRSPRPGDGEAVFHGVVETLSQLRAWPASLPWAMAEPAIAASEAFCREGHSAFLACRDMPMLMFSKTGNDFVGATGLHNPDWKVPEFEIGYWCRQSYQRQGLVTEAVNGITAWAFSVLGARRLSSRTDSENPASRRVLERAGFKLEGIMSEDRVWPDGSRRSICIYGITS
ncbi:MAG TPA: GNAT family N-acetyltransferase [Novimethylophilus sp.]|jgi:hypothetical protein|uniref:GNAT family N-acetyltransferase n=1 Tax=Novimethylophilus sp. TaxID=2137426 RepID=UPI002F3F1CEF